MVRACEGGWLGVVGVDPPRAVWLDLAGHKQQKGHRCLVFEGRLSRLGGGSDSGVDRTRGAESGDHMEQEGLGWQPPC